MGWGCGAAVEVVFFVGDRLLLCGRQASHRLLYVLEVHPSTAKRVEELESVLTIMVVILALVRSLTPS